MRIDFYYRRMKQSRGSQLILEHLMFFVLLIVLVFLVMQTQVQAQTQISQKKGVTVEKRVSDLEAEVARLKTATEIFNLDGLPDVLLIA